MPTDRTRLVTLDLVIPVFDEEAVLDHLFSRLADVFSEAALRSHGVKVVRCLFVDDGSRDRSAELIRDRIEKGFPAVLYRFSRNFGHQNAVTAGLLHATADVVAVIDADLQDPPEVIYNLLDAWRTGSDVVFGERRRRKENPLKVACYSLYYCILAFLSETSVPRDSGDFCLLDRRVVDVMNRLPEHLRFPRGLRSWVGFRQTGVPYERAARQAGLSKYTFGKLYYLATDGIASMSTRPLRIAQFFSGVFLLVSLALVAVSLRKYLTYPKESGMALWFLFTYALISIGNFMTLLCLFILSAYVGRTYLEVKGRPSFIVMETIGDDTSPEGR